jgi:predicted alpha/beta-hydrolase family hydrolase
VTLQKMTADIFQAGEVHGFLHRSENPASGGLVLTHGAGGNCRSKAPGTICAAGASTWRLWSMRFYADDPRAAAPKPFST